MKTTYTADQIGGELIALATLLVGASLAGSYRAAGGFEDYKERHARAATKMAEFLGIDRILAGAALTCALRTKEETAVNVAAALAA